MTNQEAFDTMVEHLGNLKGRSVKCSNGACVYNGSKCAVGILMTDEEQERFGSFDGEVDYLLYEMRKKSHKSHLHQLNLDMLDVMQRVHDDSYNWNDGGFASWGDVRDVANDYKLEYKGPKV